MGRHATLAVVMTTLTASCGPAPAPLPSASTPNVTPSASGRGPSCPVSFNAPALSDAELAHAIVKKICVSGNRRRPTADFRAVIRSQENAALDRSLATLDLKRLLAMDLDDAEVLVAPTVGGVVLEFMLREAPLVKRVTFIGGTTFGGQALYELLGVSATAPLDRAALARGRQNLLSEYIHRGYTYATVTTTADTGVRETDVVVRIMQGPAVVVGSIAFPGTRVMRESELAKVMLLHVGGAYSPFSLDRDVAKITAAYHDRGMLDAELAQAAVIPSPDKLSMAIQIPVAMEGAIYKLRSLKLSGDVAGREKAYLALINVKIGEIFNQAKMLASIDAVRALRRKEGSSDVVTPEVELHPQQAAVELVLHVGEP